MEEKSRAVTGCGEQEEEDFPREEEEVSTDTDLECIYCGICGKYLCLPVSMDCDFNCCQLCLEEYMLFEKGCPGCEREL